jgi:hypothetical protein
MTNSSGWQGSAECVIQRLDGRWLRSAACGRMREWRDPPWLWDPCPRSAVVRRKHGARKYTRIRRDRTLLVEGEKPPLLLLTSAAATH